MLSEDLGPLPEVGAAHYARVNASKEVALLLSRIQTKHGLSDLDVLWILNSAQTVYLRDMRSQAKYTPAPTKLCDWCDTPATYNVYTSSIHCSETTKFGCDKCALYASKEYKYDIEKLQIGNCEKCGKKVQEGQDGKTDCSEYYCPLLAGCYDAI